MFNWWTFLFQAINFFVVLYIMYRLFFNPLKNIIQKREESIKKRQDELKAGEDKIKELEEEYQRRLKEIGILKDKELSIAKSEAMQEKDRILELAKNESDKEWIKQKNMIELEHKKIDSDIKEKSLQFSINYITRFASELIDEQMHKKLIEEFLHDIKIEKTKIQGCKLKLYTPLKIDDETLTKIKQTFDCKTLVIETIQDKSLIGGIKLGFENKIIDGSIKGMINQFAQRAESEL